MCLYIHQKKHIQATINHNLSTLTTALLYETNTITLPLHVCLHTDSDSTCMPQ